MTPLYPDDEDEGEAMNLGQVIGALGTIVQGSIDTDPVWATTPHGSFTFAVVAVEKEDGKPITLRLKEIGSTKDHWAIVDEERWHVEHPLSCREVGLEKCKITRLVAVGAEEEHLPLGRSKVWLDPTGVLLWDHVQ